MAEALIEGVGWGIVITSRAVTGAFKAMVKRGEKYVGKKKAHKKARKLLKADSSASEGQQQLTVQESRSMQRHQGSRSMQRHRHRSGDVTSEYEEKLEMRPDGTNVFTKTWRTFAG